MLNFPVSSLSLTANGLSTGDGGAFEKRHPEFSTKFQ